MTRCCTSLILGPAFSRSWVFLPIFSFSAHGFCRATKFFFKNLCLLSDQSLPYFQTSQPPASRQRMFSRWRTNTTRTVTSKWPRERCRERCTQTEETNTWKCSPRWPLPSFFPSSSSSYLLISLCLCFPSSNALFSFPNLSSVRETREHYEMRETDQQITSSLSASHSKYYRWRARI